MLHGFQGAPDLIERTSGWTGFGAQVGAVVAYPIGTAAGDGYFGWAAETATYSTSGVDDVAYLLEIIDSLVRDHCVDPDRILLTGESNGAAMSIVAMCDDRARGAVAMVAAVIAAIDDGTVGACDDADATPLVVLAGRQDDTAPYQGHPAAAPTLLGQEEWLLRLAAINGCDPVPPARVPLAGAELVVPMGCDLRTELVAVDGVAHTWPGGPEGTGGLDPGPFAGTAFIWGPLLAAVREFLTHAVPDDHLRHLLCHRLRRQLAAAEEAAGLAGLPPPGQLRVLRLVGPTLRLADRGLQCAQPGSGQGHLAHRFESMGEDVARSSARRQPRVVGVLQVLLVLRHRGQWGAQRCRARPDATRSFRSSCPSGSRSSPSTRSATSWTSTEASWSRARCSSSPCTPPSSLIWSRAPSCASLSSCPAQGQA